MGLMSFWRKKPSDQSAVPPPNNSLVSSLNTDLPPIDGSLGNFDGSSVQQFGNMQQLPSLDAQLAPGENKSMAINIPTLDFSMPTFDDDGTPIDALQKPQEQVSEVANNAQSTAPNAGIDEEDLNKLFINDEWKEPDWATFEPYTEDKAEEPKPEDFKGAELPTFDDTEPMIAPSEPITEKPRLVQKPVELFIRGSAYNRVFTELDQMNRTLFKIDSQVNTYEDMLKNEEPLLIAAKEQMEYLYRKLNNVDKKIFTQ
jgi:hypothetical protein